MGPEAIGQKSYLELGIFNTSLKKNDIQAIPKGHQSLLFNVNSRKIKITSQFETCFLLAKDCTQRAYNDKSRQLICCFFFVLI